MPAAVLRYCLVGGCPELVPFGYCRAHANEREHRRGTAKERGYTARWKRRAKSFRERHPLCGQRPGGLAPVGSRCYDTHTVTLGVLVDHVVPHRGDQSLFWDELNNWQTLCASCHSAKTIAGL